MKNLAIFAFFLPLLLSPSSLLVAARACTQDSDCYSLPCSGFRCEGPECWLDASGTSGTCHLICVPRGSQCPVSSTILSYPTRANLPPPSLAPVMERSSIPYTMIRRFSKCTWKPRIRTEKRYRKEEYCTKYVQHKRMRPFASPENYNLNQVRKMFTCKLKVCPRINLR